jgi:hypothetical protein
VGESKRFSHIYEAFRRINGKPELKL